MNNLHGTVSPPLIQWCQPLYTFSFCKCQSAYCTVGILDLRSLVLGLRFVHTRLCSMYSHLTTKTCFHGSLLNCVMCEIEAVV